MIYFLPLGGIEIASSRLRVHNIIPYLNASLKLPDTYQPGDVLVIQKTPRYEELLKAKRQGAKVIYDIDDYYWNKREYKRMIDNADLVTVDSPAKAEILKAVCIPDSLDWDGTEKTDYTPNGIIGWTGYGNNSTYLNGISLPNTLRIISSPDYKNYYRGSAEFRQWSLGTVDKDLAQCEFSIYYLPDGQFESVKGMHKLLKSWAIGLPCYTSPMPDYVRAMKEAGVDGYIVTDWSKLKNIGFNPKCKEYALQYNAERISELWKKAIGDIQKESGE